MSIRPRRNAPPADSDRPLPDRAALTAPPAAHPLTASWLDAAAAIHRACFPTASWDRAAFAALLANPHVFGLIDPTGGLVLGQAVPPEGEILTIGVAPGARRRGLGRALLAGALDAMRDRGVTEIFLDVAEDNHAARALYAAAGFRDCGRRRRYYETGADALLLTCRLCE